MIFQSCLKCFLLAKNLGSGEQDSEVLSGQGGCGMPLRGSAVRATGPGEGIVLPCATQFMCTPNLMNATPSGNSLRSYGQLNVMLGMGGYGLFSEKSITAQREHQATVGPITVIVHAEERQGERYGGLFLTAIKRNSPCQAQDLRLPPARMVRG